MATIQYPKINLRLKLTAEEYASFRHYCIDHQTSASDFMSDHIKKTIARKNKSQPPQGFSAENENNHD